MSYLLKTSKFPVGAVSESGVPADGNATASEGLLLELSGELDFSSVPLLYSEIKPHLEHRQPLRIDLKAVESANSAALALLIECRAQARDNLEIANIPHSVEKIAEVCGVSDMLYQS